MHGLSRDVVWTKLSSDAAEGQKTLHLSESIDWKAGMDIVVTPTSMDNRQTERHVIAEVKDDGLTIITRDNLNYLHLCRSEVVSSEEYSHCAEVGLLTRNIKISGSPSDGFYGGRVVIGLRMIQSSESYDTYRGNIFKY